MKKYTPETAPKKDTQLEKLLLQRRAPLSEEGMKLALTDLTMYLTGNVQFLAVLFIKEDAEENEEIEYADIQKADIMEGTDGEKYFPVFSDMQKVTAWKNTLSKHEYIYSMNKEEILQFLNSNEKVAASVVNPGEDDLLLYRMQLQNMIALGSGNIQ